MPNIKSVKKDVLRSRARRLVNNAVKSRIKTMTKKVYTTLAAGDATAIAAEVSLTISAVDKAAKSNIIHKNAAARRKSRLMKRAAAVAAA